MRRHVSAPMAGVLLGAAVVLATAAPAGAEYKYWDMLDGGWFWPVYNWQPSGAPSIDDEVWITGPFGSTYTADVILAGDFGLAGTLNLDRSSELWITSGGRLLVDGAVVIDKTWDELCAIHVEDSGEAYDMSAASITVKNGAALMLTDGCVETGRITVDSDSTLEGDGTIRLSGTGTVLSMSGTLDVNGTAGGLTIDNTGGGSIDLDGGSGASTIKVAEDNDLIIEGSITDPVGGSMMIYSGGEVRLDHELVYDGWMSMWSTALKHSEFSAPGLTLRGDLNVNGHICWMSSPVNFDSGCHVTVNSGGRLALYEPTQYDGGTYDGQGGIQQDGDATFTANTTVGVATFDLDGVYGTSEITVEPGVTLTINADTIDYDAGNDYDNTMDIRGTLQMNLPADTAWTLQGRMELTGGTVRGRPTAGAGKDFKVSGDLRAFASGTPSTLDCWVDFYSDTDVYVYGGATLNVGAAGKSTRYYGGQYRGSGMIVQVGDAQFMGGTSVFTVDTYVWDGGGTSTTTVQPGATVQINSDAIEEGYAAVKDLSSGSFAGTAVVYGVVSPLTEGILEVNTPHTWHIAAGGILRLIGPGWVAKVRGTKFTSSGRIEGFGLIEQDVTNNGVVSPGLSVGSAGALWFGDDFRQGYSGEMVMEIGGASPGNNADYVLVSNTATLAGELSLSFVNAFEPDYGDSFRILGATTVVGRFDTVTGLMAPGGEMAYAVTYTDTNVWVTAAIPSDANLDGCVDGGDYTLWADNYLAPGGWEEGDFNGDGVVSGADYTIWADNYLSGCTAGAIPEPGVLLLTGAGTMALLTRRRK